MGKVTKKPDPQKQQDNIIRLASYSEGHEPCTIKIASEHKGICDSMAQPFLRSPSATLRHFNRLPPEILHEIFSLVDIRSLFRFRQLNQYARELVSAFHEYYYAIMTNALEVVCAILRTKVASWFTLRDLFNVLCTQDCSGCGSFGKLLFLPSLSRICLECAERNAQFRMISARGAVEKFGLPLDLLHQEVPVLSTLPGKYNDSSPPHTGNTLIVSGEQVSKAGHAEQWIPGIYRYCVPWQLATMTLPCLGRTDSGCVLCDLKCRGCLFAFDKAEDKTCFSNYVPEVAGRRFFSRDRLYSRSDFLEHVKQCPLIQVVLEYAVLKFKGHNLNFRVLRKFQHRWLLSNKDLECLGGYHW